MPPELRIEGQASDDHDAQLLLAGTPYLIGDGAAASKRFADLRRIAAETRDKASRVNERIRSEANQLLEPYTRAARSELVTESNVIEGINWSTPAVREVLSTHQELLSSPVRTFTEAVRADSRVYQVLGLYRAHQLADEWAAAGRAPREYEIRGLHSLILGDVDGSGSYKLHANAIGGTRHRTADPLDVPRVMHDLAAWWHSTSADPLIVATVIHAWLAHIHPFEDGNGRLARVLANLELARRDYPPLIIRAGSDRGQYYAALAASDDGDLLPLYELFGLALRREARTMARPNYTRDLIEDRLLASETQRKAMWDQTLSLLENELRTAVESRGWLLEIQGRLTPESFALLSDRDVDGNGWYAKARRPGRQSEWLLWFGFRSTAMCDLNPDKQLYPSIFISRRDRDPDAVHPFTPHFERADLAAALPQELAVMPAEHSPVGVLWESYRGEWLRPADAAESLGRALCSAPQG